MTKIKNKNIRKALKVKYLNIPSKMFEDWIFDALENNPNLQTKADVAREIARSRGGEARLHQRRLTKYNLNDFRSKEL